MPPSPASCSANMQKEWPQWVTSLAAFPLTEPISCAEGQQHDLASLFRLWQKPSYAGVYLVESALEDFRKVHDTATISRGLLQLELIPFLQQLPQPPRPTRQQWF